MEAPKFYRRLSRQRGSLRRERYQNKALRRSRDKAPCLHYFCGSHDDCSVVASKPVQRFRLKADFCKP